MNNTANPQYGFKRVVRKLLLSVSQHSLVPGRIRARLISMAGVKFVDISTTFIGAGVEFDNVYPENITVGRRARITTGCKILTHYLDSTAPPFNFYHGKVTIGDNVFIGANSLIVNECSIGNNAVIAAGSVVTKNVEANTIVGGVPAKKIGMRTV